MQTTLWRKKLLSLVAILLISTLVLAACGSDEEPEVVEEAAPAAVEGEAPVIDEVETVVAEEEIDPAAMAEEVVETEGESDTDTTSDSATMTETAVVTETGTIEVITTTEVITEVEVITDTVVTTDVEVMVGDEVTATSQTESESTEVMTDTEETEDAGDATGAAGAVVEGANVRMTGIADAEAGLMHALTLLDYNFQNRDGEVSGDLEDLLVNTETGNVLLASIEYGGFLDIGDKDIVIPLSAFSWGPDGSLVLNFDEQELQDFPDVGNDWPDIVDGTWDDEVVNYWNSIDIDPGFDFTDETGGQVMWLSNLTGYAISELGGEVAAIRDVLVDVANSRIKYAVVGFGDVADGTDLVLVPFTALDMANMTDTEVMLDGDIDMNLLESAPRYDRESYIDSDLLPGEFVGEVDGFWTEQGYEME